MPIVIVLPEELEDLSVARGLGSTVTISLQSSGGTPPPPRKPRKRPPIIVAPFKGVDHPPGDLFSAEDLASLEQLLESLKRQREGGPPLQMAVRECARHESVQLTAIHQMKLDDAPPLLIVSSKDG